MIGLAAVSGLKLAKGLLNKNKKGGNLLGKAKLFAGKLSQKLGSLDSSLDATTEDVTTYDDTQTQTKGWFDGESRKEQEARELAEAQAKKKSQMMMMIAAAGIGLFLFMRKK